MATETEICAGQVWQHRKRERRIVVERYDSDHDDAVVYTLPAGRASRRSHIFGSYLRRDYDLQTTEATS